VEGGEKGWGPERPEGAFRWVKQKKESNLLSLVEKKKREKKKMSVKKESNNYPTFLI